MKATLRRVRRFRSGVDVATSLGNPSNASLRTAGRTCRRRLRGWPARLTLVLANGRGDSIDIEVVGSTHSFPDLVELFNDGVASLHDGILVGSSSGVQMMGGSKPSERQT